MSKVNLKDNIWIEGFDTLDWLNAHIFPFEYFEILYKGKTSEIPEEIIRSVCELQDVFNTPEYINQDIDRYKNYKVTEYTWYDCTAKESIQSACSDEFCIIYKTN